MNTTITLPDMHKLVIYQIFTRLFGNTNTTNQPGGSIEQNGVGKLNHINDAALQSLRAFGVSHVWYTGVIEHATMTDYSAFGIQPDDPAVVKGRAGSPYAIRDYYDIAPDLAEDVPNRMGEFEALVQRTHAHGLKAIIDFVPNHVARQYRSDAKPDGVVDLGETDEVTVNFASNNNFYYLPGQTFISPDGTAELRAINPTARPLIEMPAKVTGNDAITATPSIHDWYETVKLNYGIDVFNNSRTQFSPIPNTWHKMLHILLFWAEKGVDGFRCDMAQMVPVAFWGWAIRQVKTQYPRLIFIAEIYEANRYRQYLDQGGFDYLYDKVGLYDALRRLVEGGGSCHDITRVWQQESGGFSERMLRFLENHDEQRIASPQFANDPWAAVAAMTVTATLHSGPLMLYFGQEIGVRADGSEGFSGDDGRTTIFDYWGLPDWQGYLNNGTFDSLGLTGDQRYLRAFYQQLNHLVGGSDAIRTGKFYDLQYAQGDGYNGHRQYSFLRFSPLQKLLIVANFDRTNTVEINIRIPDHAWQSMGLEAMRTYRFSDIFRSSRQFEAVGTAGVTLTIAPADALVLEIR